MEKITREEYLLSLEKIDLYHRQKNIKLDNILVSEWIEKIEDDEDDNFTGK